MSAEATALRFLRAAVDSFLTIQNIDLYYSEMLK